MVVYHNACVNGHITDISVENGKVISLEKSSLSGVELDGAKVYPGLVEIHAHGCMGYDVTNDPAKLSVMARFFAENGVTTWYPTTSTDSFAQLHAVSKQNIFEVGGANIPGFHFEGPYISKSKLGAMNENYVRKPDLIEFKKFDNVKLVTLAPESEGCMEFIRQCGCVVSVGHTVADYETVVQAADNGAKCVTHAFNAMPGLHHRAPSVLGAAIDKNMYVQVICDGVHIHPAVITALYRIFGSDRMILISDCVAATGVEKDGVYMFGGREVIVKNKTARTCSGALAGSTTHLLDCVRTAISFGIDEAEAFKMASLTPATLMGIPKGRLAIGYDADFIVLDEKNTLLHTIIGGKIFET